jgi:hypothetical protein
VAFIGAGASGKSVPQSGNLYHNLSTVPKTALIFDVGKLWKIDG